MNRYFCILIFWNWGACLGCLPTEKQNPELEKFNNCMEHILQSLVIFEYIFLKSSIIKIRLKRINKSIMNNLEVMILTVNQIEHIRLYLNYLEI